MEQWMISLPIGNLPKVTEALSKLPTSPDEKQLESALREAVSDWRKISPEQIEHAVNSFLTYLRSALLPIEKQTLMVIGRTVLRPETFPALNEALWSPDASFVIVAKAPAVWPAIEVGTVIGLFSPSRPVVQLLDDFYFIDWW